jgi:glutamine amidotransferase
MVFAHNGRLSELMQPGGARVPAACEPTGETDSERAFCYLLNQIATRFPADAVPGGSWWLREVAELSELVSSRGRFNFLMSDGSYLIAYGHDRLYGLERCCHGLKLALIATEPLTQDEAWESFTPGELRVYREGELLTRLATRPGHGADPAQIEKHVRCGSSIVDPPAARDHVA